MAITGNPTNTIRRTGFDLQSGESFDGFGMTYNYSSTGGLHDDEASRVTSFQEFFNTPLAEYRYNGLGTLMRTTYPEPDVFYSMDGATARSYNRLDRFNRSVSSVWTKDLATDVDFYDLDVTWDANSNVTRVVDNIHRRDTGTLGDGRFDEAYSIDGLDRLTGYDRGHWNGSAVSNGVQGELWTLDQVGNWDLHKLDLTGDGDYIDTGEFQEDRTHNVVNELTDRDQDTDNDTAYDDNNWNLVYDAPGNLTDDGVDYKFIYDPMGRLVRIDNQNDDPVSEYRYDGLGRRIAFRHDTNVDADLSDETWYHIVYDDRWRILAVYRTDDDSPKEAFAWHNAGLGGHGGSSYIDSVVFRDKDADTAWGDASDDALEERRYFCQNWRADVSVVLTDAGTPVEWIKYDPYGTPFNIPQGDTNSDGITNVFDLLYEMSVEDTTNPYDVRCDMDLDGDVEYTTDFLPFLDLFFAARTGGRGVLSRADTANRLGYAGYVFDDDITRFAHVRHRVYDTTLGRWTRRDPLGYVDSDSLYVYVGANPHFRVDPMGLCPTCRVFVSSSHVALSVNGDTPTTSAPEIDWHPARDSGRHPYPRPDPPPPPRPVIQLRCFKLPGVPGSHCAVHDKDKDRICGAGPELAPWPGGCIQGYCTSYPVSPEKQYEDACNDPLNCVRTTPIHCPDRDAADTLMACIQDYMDQVNNGCTAYRTGGPNSNTTINKALDCCLEQSGCTGVPSSPDWSPNAPPLAPPVGWNDGLGNLPPCVAVE